MCLKIIVSSYVAIDECPAPGHSGHLLLKAGHSGHSQWAGWGGLKTSHEAMEITKIIVSSSRGWGKGVVENFKMVQSRSNLVLDLILLWRFQK